MRVHQIVPELTTRDATSNQVYALDGILKKMEWESYIYASRRTPNAEKRSFPLEAYRPFLPNKKDILLYHYTGAHACEELFFNSRNKKIFIYHNITPAEYFRGYNHPAYLSCKLGRERLPKFRQSHLALGDSEYNRQELLQAGFDAARTDVLPIILNLDALANSNLDSNTTLRYGQNGVTNLLYVGRIVPNKKIEGLIRVFYYYHRFINRRSQLFLVGSKMDTPHYMAQLELLLAELEVAGKVILPGGVSLSQLKSFYQLAHVYLCLSEHEGFCVPLLESMYFGVPIVALARAAVPYTLGKAGILVSEPDHPLIAELINEIMSNQDFRRTIVEHQKERLKDFSPIRIEEKFRGLIQRVAEM